MLSVRHLRRLPAPVTMRIEKMTGQFEAAFRGLLKSVLLEVAGEVLPMRAIAQ